MKKKLFSLALALALCFGLAVPAFAVEAAEPVLKFTDLPSWCAKEAQWAVKRGITNGYGAKDKFAPGVNCSQVEILTFLHRAENKPAAESKSPFTVASYYQGAVDWAYEKGIIGDDFTPGAPCTRAQAVTCIWKARNEPKTKEAAKFSGGDASSPVAPAVSWAVEKGVTKGYGGADTFAPERVCTRGEIVTFLYRAYDADTDMEYTFDKPIVHNPDGLKGEGAVHPGAYDPWDFEGHTRAWRDGYDKKYREWCEMHMDYVEEFCSTRPCTVEEYIEANCIYDE